MSKDKTKPIVLVTLFRARLRGLLFTKPHNLWLLFSPCRGVHTFGMRYTVDIAFLNREGVVLESFRGVGPMRTFRNRQAVVVIERFESGEPWLDPRDKVNLRVSRSPHYKKK